MVDVLDVEVGILPVDQLAEGRGVLGVAVVGDGRRSSGARAASDSAVVCGRGNSSWSRATVPSRLRTGIRLLSKRPSLMATSARRCDSAAWASSASRGMPSSVAMASAHTPWWRLRVELLQVEVVRAHREQALLRQRHHLGAAGDHEVLHAGHDGVGGEVGRGDARAAEAVEGDAAGRDVVAGVERGHAAEVAGLLARPGSWCPRRRRRRRRCRSRCGRASASSTVRPEVLGMQVGERALALLADPARGAAGVDDVGVGHGGAPGDRRQTPL